MCYSVAGAFSLVLVDIAAYIFCIANKTAQLYINRMKDHNLYPDITVNSKQFSRFKKFKLIFVVICIAIFTGIAWYSYVSQVKNFNEDDLPLIKQTTQVKFKPENPGGLVVPNTDKDIYDHISGKKSKSIVKTRSVHEKATSHKEMFEVLEKKKAIKNIDSPPNPVKLSNEVSNKEERVEPVDKNHSYVASSVLSKKNADSNVRGNKVQKYEIRIAKIKNERVFKKAWEIMTLKHGEFIGDLKPKLKIENIDGKKAYYLHAGAVESFEKARKICESLKDQGLNKCKILKVI